MKYNFLILIFLLSSAGCTKEPSQDQLHLVDRLIQEQIDIPYKEPNWKIAKEHLAKSGETVNEAAERNKKLYSDIHNYLVDLRTKPYKDKRDWAVKMLTMELDLLEKSLSHFEEQGNLDASADARKELAAKIKERKEWLATLK